MAVNDPFAIFETGRGLDGPGIATSVLRFGHRVARFHHTLDEGEEPLALLLFRAVLEENFLVTRVGSHDAEEAGGAQGVGQDFVHVGVGENVESHTAVLFGEVGGPEAGRLHLGLDFLAQRLGVSQFGLGHDSTLTANEEFALTGQNFGIDEVGRPNPYVVDVVG